MYDDYNPDYNRPTKIECLPLLAIALAPADEARDRAFECCDTMAYGVTRLGTGSQPSRALRVQLLACRRLTSLVVQRKNSKPFGNRQR